MSNVPAAPCVLRDIRRCGRVPASAPLPVVKTLLVNPAPALAYSGAFAIKGDRGCARAAECATGCHGAGHLEGFRPGRHAAVSTLMLPGLGAAARGEVREIRPTTAPVAEATTPLGRMAVSIQPITAWAVAVVGFTVSHRNAALGVFLTDCDARPGAYRCADLQAQSAFGTGRVVAVKRRTVKVLPARHGLRRAVDAGTGERQAWDRPFATPARTLPPVRVKRPIRNT